MLQQDKSKAYILLHIAVILFGFTAILGNLIQLSAIMIVWWRVLITCISLLWFIQFGKKLKTISHKDKAIFFGIGLLVGIHWLSFYGAVKLSNASITLICMAMTSLFTAIFEPLFFRKKHSALDMTMGLSMVPCMYLVVSGTTLDNLVGVWVGLLAALFAAVFTILNKKYMGSTDTISVTFIELTAVFFLMTVLLPFFFQVDHLFWPTGTMDWIYIGVLALLCTTVAWVISLMALKHLTAFEANLVVNLEPVYGIALAAVILHEYKELTPTFYLGAALILTIIVLHPRIKNRMVNISKDQDF